MKAIVDADILAYEFGSVKGEDGEVLPFSFAAARLRNRIDQIIDATEAEETELWLSPSITFRHKAATILPYKGHRDDVKPIYWKKLRQLMIDEYDARFLGDLEADDAVAISAMKDPDNSVICSLDKDLNMIPVSHYNWRKDFIYRPTPSQSIKFFYKQLLTGDMTDNILGLYGVGKKSKLLLEIDKLEDELDMFKYVLDQYNKRFGTYGPRFMVETGYLLWIMRDEEDNYIQSWIELRGQLKEQETKEKEVSEVVGIPTGVSDEDSLQEEGELEERTKEEEVE